MKKLIPFLLLLLAFQTQAQNPTFISDSLEKCIVKGMADFNIPGLAIAIVKDGKTVIMKGFGTRTFGKNEPVDENTLFMIASNSKLFTGTALAKLEDEKKLSLDDKVTKYHPDFKLNDEAATRLINIKDILSHRVGFKTFQGDFLNWDSNLSREEVIAAMRRVKAPQNFRQDYGYCNSCFVTAGQIIPKVTGQTWEDYVHQNIVEPIGMTNTYMLTEGFGNRLNHAKPYSNSFGNLAQVPYDQIDNLAPAGSMVSCVKDIARWLQFQLDSGKVNGKQVLNWKAIQKTRLGNSIVRSTKSSALPVHYSLYALGVFNTEYAGRQVFHHTGGASGFVTNTCFVPEANLGITILTNNDNQNFFELLRYQILDAYLGVPYTNRVANALKAKIESDKTVKTTLENYEKQVTTKPKMPIEEKSFLGKYKNEFYGEMTIEKSGSNLVAKFEHHPNLIGKLDLMNEKEFLLKFDNLTFGIAPAKFTLENNQVKNIEIKISDFVEYDAYLFEKVK